MRLVLAVLALIPAAGAMAQEVVTFSLPAPVSAFSGGPGVYFHLPLTIEVPFAAEERPDLVVGRADAPNPAAEGVESAYQAALAAYEAALRAYEANQAARRTAQRALDTVYPARVAAYEADLASWRLCRRQPLVRCGSRPRRPARPRVPAALPLPEPPERSGVPATIDTRNGPIVDFAVEGMTWTTLDYRASLGTIDPTLTYRLAMVAPGPAPAGTPVQLRAEATLVDGTIDGTSPTYRIVLGQSLRIDRGEIAAGACVAPSGCSETGTFRTEPAEEYVEILEITPQGTTFFGQTLPERFLRAGLPGLELEVSANLNLDADDTANPIGISVNGVSIPPEMTIGIATELATGRLEYPVLELPGELEDDGIVRGEATSDFVSLDVDVDTATTLVGGASIGNDLVSVGADLWDITAGPRLRPYQSMEMRPTIELSLAFDRPVEIEGQGRAIAWSGPPDTIPPIRLDGETRVTPTWTVAAWHSSELGLSFLAEIEVELIIAEINAGGAFIEYGPFAPEIPVMASDSIDFPLTEDAFPVSGFSVHEGETLVLRTGK